VYQVGHCLRLAVRKQAVFWELMKLFQLIVVVTAESEVIRG